jgi:hypothetical protein
MTRREVATVLAALTYWRRFLPDWHEPHVLANVIKCFPPGFEREVPLNADEIDAVCARLMADAKGR